MLAFGEAAEHAAPLGFWDSEPRILLGDINFFASREHGQGNSSLPMVQRIADKVAQGFIEVRNNYRSRYLGIDGDCAAQFVSQRQKLGGNLPGEARRVDKGPAMIGLAGCIGDSAALIARVKVATAEMYPRVTLGASGGLIGGLLDAFVTPLITWSFLNPARIKARIALAEANQQGALAQYDAAWLRALREVETALADTDAERRTNRSLTAAVTAAQSAARRAEARVQLGDANPLLALDARRTAFETELLATLSARRLAQREVFLLRSLGGGWKQAENDGAQRPDERENTADFCGFQRCRWMSLDGKLER